MTDEAEIQKPMTESQVHDIVKAYVEARCLQRQHRDTANAQSNLVQREKRLAQMEAQRVIAATLHAQHFHIDTAGRAIEAAMTYLNLHLEEREPEVVLRNLH